MWQAPNQRGDKKRTRERMRLPLHMQRIEAEMKIGESASSKTIQVRIVLNDFSIKGIGIYGTAPFPVGESILLQFQQPRRLIIHGRLVWSQSIETTNHILSSVRYTHRGGIEFLPTTAEEEADIEAFCNELCKELGETSTPKAPE